MALETYDLKTLRDQLKSEFGIELSDTQKDADILAKINQGVDDIIREGPWHFQMKPLALAVAGQGKSTGDLTQGSASIANVAAVSGEALAKYDILFVASTLGGAEGYLVTAVTGTTATIDAAYSGATATAANLVHARAFFSVPSDLKSVHVLYDTALIFQPLMSVSPYRFELERIAAVSSLGFPNRYTVVQDPLKASTARFLGVFPYLTNRTVLRGLYFCEPDKLSNPSDVPLIPRDHRTVLFNWAAWLYALHANDGRAGLYENRARQGLASMAEEYLMQDDPDVATSENDLPFPVMKASYPELAP